MQQSRLQILPTQSNPCHAVHTVECCILGKMGHLQQVLTQVGEHCHLQLFTADLLSQTQVVPTVTWAELTCQD